MKIISHTAFRYFTGKKRKTKRNRFKLAKRKSERMTEQRKLELKRKKRLRRVNALLKRRRRRLRLQKQRKAAMLASPSANPPVEQGFNQNLIVCSVTSASNLHRAKVMARSVKQHEPSAKVVICVVEEFLHPAARSEHVDEWILAKDLNIPGFYQKLFKYNIFEGPTSMKAATLKYAMRKYADEKLFIYLDTDMRVYHPLTELREAMNQHPILLSPHVLTPTRHSDDYLHYGIFNSGLLALTRNELTEQFLNWWEEKLYQSCYYDDTHFADQGWLDFAPLYFDAEILRHPGYNLAAWNISPTERAITHEANGYYYINDKPLCIFHYSGVWGFLQHAIEVIFPERNNLLYPLLERYKAELDEMGRKEISSIPWSYDYFSNGVAITDETRKEYKDNPNVYQSMINPYKESNVDFGLRKSS